MKVKIELDEKDLQTIAQVLAKIMLPPPCPPPFKTDATTGDQK